MKDLTILLDNRPGALADMGDALGRAGVSIEGGGAWVVDGQGVAHFLFEDGAAAPARSALEAAGRFVGLETVGSRRSRQKMTTAIHTEDLVKKSTDSVKVLIADLHENGARLAEKIARNRESIA